MVIEDDDLVASAEWTKRLRDSLLTSAGLTDEIGRDSLVTVRSGYPIKPAVITRNYGVRCNWQCANSKLPALYGYHTGVDYRGAVGQRVYAVYAGTILDEDWGPNYGIHVVLNVKGLGSFVYGNLSRKNVNYGQRVALGDVIGFGGDADNVAVHLEFRVYPYRANVDTRNPLDYMGKEPASTTTVRYMTARSANGGKMVTSFVNNCKMQVDATLETGINEDQPSEDEFDFDGSELVFWAAYQAGLEDYPESFAAQVAYCRRVGIEIPISGAYKTYGAILFRVVRGMNQIAVSLGNGRTIEGVRRSYEIRDWDATNRNWTFAVLVPGLRY